MSEEHEEPLAPSSEVASRPLSNEIWAVASSRWINDHIRNSPVAQSTEAWNHLGSVLHKLREYLEAEMKK